MSVQMNHYFIIGTKFEYDEFYQLFSGSTDHEEIEKFIDEVEDKYSDSAFAGIERKNLLTIISDGMSGKYVCIGYVIQKSGDSGALDDYVADGIAPTPEQVSELIRDTFGVEVDCKYLAFTHYR